MKTPVYDGEGWKISPSCPVWESTLEFSMLLKKAALRRFIKIVVWGNERRIGCVTFLNMLVCKAKLVAQHINKYDAGTCASFDAGTCASFEVEDNVFQLLEDRRGRARRKTRQSSPQNAAKLARNSCYKRKQLGSLISFLFFCTLSQRASNIVKNLAELLNPKIILNRSGDREKYSMCAFCSQHTSFVVIRTLFWEFFPSIWSRPACC